MPKATNNPRKKVFQDMLAQNGRRLDWIVAQLKISRQRFDEKIKGDLFTEPDWVKITDLVVKGTTSHYCTNRHYTARPRHNRVAKSH